LSSRERTVGGFVRVSNVFGLALSFTTTATAAWVVGSLLWTLLESRWLGPVADFWLFVPQLAAHYDGAPLWDLLWNPQGGHRMPFPRLLYLAEYRFFAATNVFLIGTSLALQGFGAAVLARFVWKRPGGLSRSERLFLCASAVLLLFSATQIENFARGWNVHHFLACQAVLWALLALTKAVEARARSAVAAGGWLVLTVGCGVLASYSMGSGLTVWPILLVLGARTGLPRAQLALLALVGTATVAGYFVGHPLGAASAGERVAAEPTGVLSFARACLGGPLSWIRPRAAAWLSMAALGLVGASGLRFLLKGPRAHPLHALYLGLAVFAAGAALLAAIGRSELFPDSWDARRYQTFVAFFWIGVIGLGVLHTAGSGRRRPARALLALAAGVWLGGVLLPAHSREAAALGERAAEVRQAHDAILVGVGDRRAYKPSMPKTARRRHGRDPVQVSRPFLAERRLGMFAVERHDRLGIRLVDHFESAPETECEGELDNVLFFGASAKLSGVIRGEHEILVADERGQVIGLGRPRRRGIVKSETRRRRWTAWLGPTAPESPIAVLAVLHEGQVCRIAGPVPLRAGRAGLDRRR